MPAVRDRVAGADAAVRAWWKTVCCRALGHKVRTHKLSKGWVLKSCGCGHIISGLYAPGADK